MEPEGYKSTIRHYPELTVSNTSLNSLFLKD